MFTCKQRLGDSPNTSPDEDTKALGAACSTGIICTSEAAGMSSGWHEQDFSSSPGVVARLSLWISSPIFPRYHLLPSISGKPAHSAGLHAAIICLPQILYWLAIARICSSVPLGESVVGVDFTQTFQQDVQTTFQAFLKAMHNSVLLQLACSLWVLSIWWHLSKLFDSHLF